MNRKLKICIDLINEQESNYNLRQTADRRSRQAEGEENRQSDSIEEEKEIEPVDTEIDEEEIEIDEEIHNESSDLDISDLIEDDHINVLDMTTTTAIVTHGARFTGKVDDSDPDKKKREAYSVDQFLADVDSRIQARNLTRDPDKIKEALLLVDPEKGDAHRILTSSSFKEIATYDEFKNSCRVIWKPKAYKDKFYNLQMLRNLKKKGSDFSYITDIQDVIDRVVDDIATNTKFTKVDGGLRNQMYDLRQVITYVAYGTLYDSISDEYQRAFKKLTLDPNVGLIKLMDQIIEKANETKVKQELVAYTDSSPSTSDKKTENVMVTHQHGKQRGKRGQSHRGRGVQHSYRGRGQGRVYQNQNLAWGVHF